MSASRNENESLFSPFGTRVAQPPTAEGLVVLTRDGQLLETLQTVAHGHKISIVAAEAELAIHLLSEQGGVAVIDSAAVASPIAQLTERLKTQFPDLVLVVAGSTADQATLTSQIGTGTVYRFLHKPLSEQRVKLFIDAAWRRHGEEHAGIIGIAQTQPARTIAPPRSFQVFWIAAAAALLVVGALWISTRKPAQDITVAPSQPLAKPAAVALPAPAASLESRAAGVIERIAEPTPEVAEPVAPAPPPVAATAEPVAIPANTEAEDKQRQLAERLISEARKAFAANDADEGERWLQAAREAGVSEESLDSLTREAQRVRFGLRAEILTRLTQQFNERLAQDRLVEPVNDSAKFYLAQLKQTEAEHPFTRIAQQALAARLVAQARSFVPRQDFSAARRWLSEAREAGADATSIVAVENEITAAQTPVPQDNKSVASIALNKIRHVDPEYPAQARKLGTNGWVDVELAVQGDGSVGEVIVVRADPPGLFEKAAVAAVRQWRYEPVTRDGQPVEQRTKVRIRFQLE